MKKFLLVLASLSVGLGHCPVITYAHTNVTVVGTPSAIKIPFSLMKDLPLPTTSSAVTIPTITNPSLVKPTKHKKKKLKWVTRYVNSERVNIRKKTTTKSKIIKVVKLNTKFKCAKINKNWYIVKFKKRTGYIFAKLLSKKRIKIPHKTYAVPYNNGFMSYMPYNLFCSSPQKRLQVKHGYTGRYGIRQVKGRYCVAIGSHFITRIGTYFDLILKNGTVIPCILADQKANRDTDSNNIITTHDGSIAEFIVNTHALNRKAKRSGNIASCNSKWKSPIKYIKVYKKRI